MFAFENGDEFEQLQLSAVDDDGRISVAIGFDTDQLAEAQIELDRRWFDELGYDDDHTARIMSAVTYMQTPSSVAATSHSDLVYVDHRPIGFESGDGSTMVSMIGSLFHEVVTTIPVVHRMSDQGTVIERVQTAVDEVGVNRLIVLALWKDGLTHRVETYDTDQLDAALARFDVLVAEPPPSAPTNGAWEIASRL